MIVDKQIIEATTEGKGTVVELLGNEIILGHGRRSIVCWVPQSLWENVELGSKLAWELRVEVIKAIPEGLEAVWHSEA